MIEIDIEESAVFCLFYMMLSDSSVSHIFIDESINVATVEDRGLRAWTDHAIAPFSCLCCCIRWCVPVVLTLAFKLGQ